jgi:hypothetical protein
MKALFRIGVPALAVALAAAALVPVGARALARRDAARALRELERVASRAAARSSAPGLGAADPSRLVFTVRPALASWATIGGCGAGGGSASSSGGGIKWVGRNVTGGLVDVQAVTSQTLAQGNELLTINTRIGLRPAPGWTLACYLPVLYKVGEVTVLGASKSARIAGFGDFSLEASRKLGRVGSHEVTLVGSAPTGSADAVRQGVVLPQHLQLGSGVPALTAQYQHTRDHDWGLVLAGGTLTYAGWENDIGDYRAPSATVSAHVGYLIGPFIPSAGLTLFGKPQHDRERGADRPSNQDPLFQVIPSLGLEWSNDWIAVMPAATLGLSYNGYESVSIGVGVSSSLF